MTLPLFLSYIIISISFYHLGKSGFMKNFISHRRNKKEREILSRWDNMITDYEKIKRVIQSSYTENHLQTSRKMISLFADKYYFNTDFDICGDRKDIIKKYNDKVSLSRSMWVRLRDSYLNDQYDPINLKDAKLKYESEKKRNNREKRLKSLLE